MKKLSIHVDYEINVNDDVTVEEIKKSLVEKNIILVKERPFRPFADVKWYKLDEKDPELPNSKSIDPIDWEYGMSATDYKIKNTSDDFEVIKKNVDKEGRALPHYKIAFTLEDK